MDRQIFYFGLGFALIIGILLLVLRSSIAEATYNRCYISNPTPTPSITQSPTVTPTMPVQATVTPVETQKEQNPISPPSNEQHPYGPNECHGISPKNPTLLFLGNPGSGCARFLVEQTDPYDHAFFSYGYTIDHLVYGIPYLQKEAKIIDVCGLETGKNVWGKICTEAANYCVSCSDAVDPFIF